MGNFGRGVLFALNFNIDITDSRSNHDNMGK